jgi:predicted DsbA family dithiol-disulfide isomerase
MEPPRLDIAFVSDVACPWCAIGLASLDQAVARLKGEVETTLHVEPFELNPDMGPEGAEVVPPRAREARLLPSAGTQPLATHRHAWRVEHRDNWGVYSG